MKTPPQGYVPIPAFIGEPDPTEIHDGYGLFLGRGLVDLVEEICGIGTVVSHESIPAWLRITRDMRDRLAFVQNGNNRPFVVAPALLDQGGWYAAIERDLAETVIDPDAAQRIQPPEPIDDTAARFALLDPYPVEGEEGPGKIGEIKGKEHFETKPKAKNKDDVIITHVSYQCLRVTGQFENDRIEMRAEIQEGQDVLQVANKLRELCERAIMDRRAQTPRRRNAS